MTRADRAAHSFPAKGGYSVPISYFLFTYLATYSYPGHLIQVRLSDMTAVLTLTLEADESFYGSALLDTDANYAYFGIYDYEGASYRAGIVKIQLSNFTRVDTLWLPEGEYLSYTSTLAAH